MTNDKPVVLMLDLETVETKALPDTEAWKRHAPEPDLASILGDLTNLIQNERVKSYNEGFDAAKSASAPPDTEAWKRVIEQIGNERQRQIAAEGWTPEHDDEHNGGEMALAAACYALATVWPFHFWGDEWVKRIWPWDWKWWKPSGGKGRNLIKAAALIVAEIERIERAARAKLVEK